MKPKQIRNLSKDKIIDYAILQLEENGLLKLSMRKIAIALNVQVSALYNHFINKEALIAALQNHYLAPGNKIFAIDFAANSWQDFLYSIANTAHQEFLERPYVLELFATYASNSKESALHFEKYLAKMLEFGFDVNTAAQISQTIYTYVCGYTSFELGVVKSANKNIATQTIPIYDTNNMPLFNQFYTQFGWNLERDFAFGIKSLINGFQDYSKKC